MRRLLIFNYVNNEDVLQENEEIVFGINGHDLKFDALQFYLGIYKGNEKTTLIEIQNRVTDDPLRKGNYIFQWLSEIVSCIEHEFGEVEEIISTHEEEPRSRKLRVIPLYDMSACAGDGLYIGSDEASFSEYSVDNPDADYAVKISGKSMEPTILDGSIVLIKRVDQLEHDEIGIFNINGNSMCKRFTKVDGKITLVPDNTANEYKTIEIRQDMVCSIQGKVISVM